MLLYYAPDGGSSEAGAVDGGFDVGEPAGLSGYAGGSIWSSTAVIDRKRQQLYVTTGNNYNVAACRRRSRVVLGNYVDSVVALDLTPPARSSGGDRCRKEGKTSGPSRTRRARTPTSAAAPTSSPRRSRRTPKDLVGTLEQRTLAALLGVRSRYGRHGVQQQVGPGGHLGGIHWGTAADGSRLRGRQQRDRDRVHSRRPGHPGWPTDAHGCVGGAQSGDGRHPMADTESRAPRWGTQRRIWSTGLWWSSTGCCSPDRWTLPGRCSHSMPRRATCSGRSMSGATVYGSPAVVGGVVYWGAGYPSRLGFRQLDQEALLRSRSATDAPDMRVARHAR